MNPYDGLGHDELVDRAEDLLAIIHADQVSDALRNQALADYAVLNEACRALNKIDKRHITASGNPPPYQILEQVEGMLRD